MDNTLYTHAAYAAHQEEVLVRRLAREKGWPLSGAQERLDRFRGDFSKENRGRKPSLGNSFLAFGISIETSVLWRNEEIQPERFLRADDELARVLGALAEAFRLAVVTNNPVELAGRTLKCLGVSDCFSTIVGLDSTGKSKPAPEPFLLAAENLGLVPRTCVSIGDRHAVDIEPALEVGMDGILVAGVGELYELESTLAQVYGVTT